MRTRALIRSIVGALIGLSLLAIPLSAQITETSRVGWKNTDLVTTSLSWAADLDSAMYLPAARPASADSTLVFAYGADGQIIFTTMSISGDTIISGADTILVAEIASDTATAHDAFNRDSTLAANADSVVTDLLRVDGISVSPFFDLTIADGDVDMKEGYTPSSWTKAGESISAFELLYYAPDSTWKLADADTSSGAGSFYAKRGMGMATANISNGSSGTIMTRGVAHNTTWNWTKIGAYLYVSTTAGGLTEAPADTTAGHASQIVGWVIHPDMIMFDVNFPWASK
ncbi:MAG: hypothetical protein KOO63_05500 [Bacteroidales bacterium]|nr:hypothetical protein [Candidatus Latescibacterota bacterium]